MRQVVKERRGGRNEKGERGASNERRKHLCGMNLSWQLPR